MVIIFILIIVTTLVAWATHAVFRNYVLGIIVTAVVMTGIMALLVNGSATWDASIAVGFAIVFAIAAVISAITGAPLAIRRRKIREQLPGFDVVRRED